jgi:hypothetical protein
MKQKVICGRIRDGPVSLNITSHLGMTLKANAQLQKLLLGWIMNPIKLNKWKRRFFQSAILRKFPSDGGKKILCGCSATGNEFEPNSVSHPAACRPA